MPNTLIHAHDQELDIFQFCWGIYEVERAPMENRHTCPKPNSCPSQGPGTSIPRASMEARNTQQMAHRADVTAIPSTPEPAIRSPAAQRMHLHRQRRRDGRRWLSIEIWETEVDALISKGFLKADARNTPDAVREALYGFLDDTLGTKP